MATPRRRRVQRSRRNGPALAQHRAHHRIRVRTPAGSRRRGEPSRPCPSAQAPRRDIGTRRAIGGAVGRQLESDQIHRGAVLRWLRGAVRLRDRRGGALRRLSGQVVGVRPCPRGLPVRRRLARPDPQAQARRPDRPGRPVRPLARPRRRRCARRYGRHRAGPLHRWRLLKRRYNQAAEIARPLAAAAGLPYWPDALGRRRRTDSQGGKSSSGRRRNVAGAFEAAQRWRPRIAGARLLLVDDVLTTGATAPARSGWPAPPAWMSWSSPG